MYFNCFWFYKASELRNDNEGEDTTLSYNEADITRKLAEIKLLLDPITGEAKYLKELNSLGNRKHIKQDPCAADRKSSKST